MKSVLAFATLQEEYLREMIRLLKQLKKANRQEEWEACQREIETLTDDYFDYLPTYDYEIISGCRLLFYEEQERQKQAEIIQDMLFVCQMLLRKPSYQTFVKMAEEEHPCLWEDTRYSKQFLENVMLCLVAKQKKLERRLRMSPNLWTEEDWQQEWTEAEQLWITVVKMANASESVLLYAIQNAKLHYDAFYRFALEVTASRNVTETVMIALVEKIGQTSYEFMSQEGNKSVRTRMTILLLELAPQTKTVLGKIVTTIQPSEKYYYDFYRCLIHYGRKDRNILKAIYQAINQKGHSHYPRKRSETLRLNMLLKNMA